MLFVTLGLLLSGAPEQAPQKASDDIVVVAERMRKLKLATKTDRRTGQTRCVLKRSSGDPAFDAMMCQAVLACARTVAKPAEMEACLAPEIAAYAQSISADAVKARTHQADPERTSSPLPPVAMPR